MKYTTMGIIKAINETANNMQEVVQEAYDEIVAVLEDCTSKTAHLNVNYSHGNLITFDESSQVQIKELRRALESIFLRRGEVGIRDFKEFLYTKALPAFVSGWSTNTIPSFMI